MDEAQFKHALITVMVFGTVVIAAGTTALYLAFRALERAKGGNVRHIVLSMVVIAIVLLAAVVLFSLSFAR